MKRTIVACGVIALSAFAYGSVSAKPAQSGKLLYLYGNSAAAMGRGGAGVSGYGADLFYMNPATSAELERVSASLQYGDLAGAVTNPQVGLLVPTSYGVFGGSFRYMSVKDDSADMKTGYYGTLGAGKEFTDQISLGLAVNFLKDSYDGGSGMYPGFTLGMLYRTKIDKEFGKGFGFFKPRLGVSVNGGLPLGDEKAYSDQTQATAGISFGFFRNRDFTLGLFNDFSAFSWFNSAKYSDKFGVEAVIRDEFIVRAGGSVPQKYEYGDATFGLGYRRNFSNLSLQADYALVHYKGSSFVHYLGVTAEFGELDRTPPATSVSSSQEYISPNHDGMQDYALISLGVKDRSKIKGWQLQILDQKGGVVKEFKSPDRDVIQSLTFRSFFTRLISPKESAVVPENLMWDGVDASGAPVADGKYLYSFWAWDERNNYAEKKIGEINVDRTVPAAELKNDDVLFSPNGDGKKDEFLISQKITTSPEDVWEAAFVDADGNPVKTFKWTGSAVPAVVKWDGKGDDGKDVPEGLYRYRISAKDKAGNAFKQVIPEISLTRKFENADISVSRDYFSFNKDSNLVFRPSLSSKEGLMNWQVTVENESGKVIRAIKGSGKLPEKLDWDVTNDDRKQLSDGKYFYSVKGAFNSGNEPVSFKKQVIVDSTPPEAEVSSAPEYFSPDNDNENDVLTIKPEASDKFGIADWNIVIKNPQNIVFKQFSGKGTPPKEIKWDGISDKGELVESATDYTMTLTVTDNAGNLTQSAPSVISVDILVIVTERGLKIRISNIQFDYDKAVILPQGKKILNRVATIFEKYEKYKVLIEGHTDDIGNDDYNLKLSERRAQAVFDYLVSKGIDKDRLKVRGMGETSPFVPNKDSESRRKNRRVEFLLEKTDKAPQQ
jgi:outer membrane protein OmpA-like peptidoglycan-associated protein/flagellar hook assembly protein FlgD